MMMTTLIYSRVIFIVICLIASLIAFKKKKVILAVIPIVLMIGINLIPVLARNFEPKYEGFNKLNISHTNDINGLTILKKGDMNVLYDEVKKREVTYHDYNKDNQKLKLFSPVYLRDLGEFYLLVYSTNPNADYNHGRFLQGDYEFFPSSDRIYFVKKSNGMAFALREYELIGKTIDLDSIYEKNEAFVYHVFLDFEEDISYVGVIVTNKQYNPKDFRMMNMNPPEFHYHAKDDYSYIEKFVMNDEYKMIWLNSYGKMFYYSFNYYFRQDGYGSSGGGHKEIFLDEEYVKEGYFTERNGSIYFVNDDLKIYKFRSLGVYEYVADVIQLETWESQLPQ